MRVSHQFVAVVTVASVAAFFVGRAYERAKIRFFMWRESGDTRKFGRGIRTLTVICLLAGVAALAVQARGGR